MEGTLANRELSPRIREQRDGFAMAERADDAEIRQLLRESPLRGAISISLEREPDYFAEECNPGQTRQTIVARRNGRLVCVGSCTIRERFVKGQPVRVGYLAGLRLATSHAGQATILRHGYKFFQVLQEMDPADFYFTSIASDNHRARRVLETSALGLPTYEHIGELVTLMIPVSGRAFSKCPPKPDPCSGKEQADRLNRFNAEFQFSPVWTVAELHALASLGLRQSDFLEAGTACGALWNQNAYKQTIVRGYSRGLAVIRPWCNVLSHLTGGIRLPKVGQPVRSACISHLIARADDDLIRLLKAFLQAAARKGTEMLTIAFAKNDPRLSTLRRAFRPREYRTCMYLVHWPGCGKRSQSLDGRLIAPELATL